MIKRRLTIPLLCMVAALGLSPLPSRAQSDKPTLRLFVGFAPGGSVDAAARALAEKLRDSLGQNVIVESKPGAGQRIALNEVKRAAPDGQTLILSTNGPFVLFPHTFKKLDYDPVKDFTPVARVASFDLAIAVGPKGPSGGIREVVAWAKANPKQADFGTSGAGFMGHFVGIMLGKASGVELNHVAYKGGVPALTDLVGGQIPILIDTPLEAMEMFRAGKLHFVATTGEARSRILPEVPTLKESGIDMAAEGFFAVYGPAKMPAHVVKRLSAAIAEAVKAPDMQEKLIKFGLTPAASTSDELAAIQADHLKRWEAPIKASGFTSD